MRKKLLSLLLVLCMVLALAPAALADDVRETDFLDEQTHADVDYADMEIVEVTEEQFLAAIDDTRALITAHAANETVLDAFHKVTGLMDTIDSNLTLLSLRNSADVNDEASQEEYKVYEALYYKIRDPFLFLIQDLLKSDCRDYFIKTDRLTESDVIAYETFQELTEEQAALNQKITEYQLAYSAAGEDDEDTMYEMFIAVRDANIESLKFQDTYDTYAELAYAEIYGRDYTVEDAQAFFEAVKTYIAPLSKDFHTIADLEQNAGDEAVWDVLYGDYTTDETLTLIRPYLGQISGELLEAWDYMIGHRLYDIGFTDTVKDDQGYTTMIRGYGAPFFFNTPTGTLFDFTTTIHEFGHYNNYFCHPHDWNGGQCSFDVAEVHSQGLELLFTQFYDDIFGEYSQIAEDYVMDNMIAAVITGALVGELELYAYSSPDVTVDMINEKYDELQSEYDISLIPWIEIPHMTLRPLYYISYATSAIGALSFWDTAQELGFDEAADLYLEFVSQPYYGEFQEEFEEILGVNPMDADYIAAFAEDLYERLDVEARQNTTCLFPDVTAANPYIGSYVDCYNYDLIHGSGDGLFLPEKAATRAETVQAFYNLLSQLPLGVDDEEESPFTDVNGKWYEEAANFCAAVGIVNGRVNDKGECVFDGDVPITREELAVIAYRALTLFFDVPTDPNPALAGAPVSPWAADAMNALVNAGWLDPTTDPHRVETRNSMVVILHNVLLSFI